MKQEETRIELVRDFINKMLRLGYAPWYIGEQVALLIKALDTKGGS